MSGKKKKFRPSYQVLGGRVLTSQVLLDEVDPICEPLGPRNKLVLAPGVVGETLAPCSGRLVGKSALTGGIKEANSGGTAAHKLARLGYQAVIMRILHNSTLPPLEKGITI